MEIERARVFLRHNHRAVLATRRVDGSFGEWVQLDGTAAVGNGPSPAGIGPRYLLACES